MRWTWDPQKGRSNAQKHGLTFETAQLVFDDPLAVSRLDDSADEERWQTVGMIENVVVLVVHTTPRPDLATGEETGRIISARKATPHEKRTYEEDAF